MNRMQTKIRFSIYLHLIFDIALFAMFFTEETYIMALGIALLFLSDVLALYAN